MPKVFRYYYGTREGGLKAKKANIERYGADYYSRMGSIGGRATGMKGFAVMSPEKRREAGRKGGSRSSRAGVANGEGKRIRKDTLDRLTEQIEKEYSKKGLFSRIFKR